MAKIKAILLTAMIAVLLLNIEKPFLSKKVIIVLCFSTLTLFVTSIIGVYL